MTAHLLDAGRAAWISESEAQKSFYDRPTLALDGTGANEKRALLWFPNPVARRGDSVISATLSLYPTDTSQWSGTTIITVERITQSWKQSAVKWGGAGNTPSVSSNAVATETATNPASDVPIEIDVTDMLRDVTSGNAWYGFRITIDTDGTKRVHSPQSGVKRSRPTLLVDMTTPPDAPDNLRPDGDNFGSGNNAPLLDWTFSSSDANAYQQESQVQITSTEADYSAAVYDSDFVANDATYFDTSLADTPPALLNNVQYWWRVRVRDQNGETSEYSDEATFIHAATGDVQIVDPELDLSVVEDNSPTITWYTDDIDQSQVRIRVWSADPNSDTKVDLLYERPWTTQQQELDDDDEFVGYDSFQIPSSVPSRRGTGEMIVSEAGSRYAVEVALRDSYSRRDDDFISDTRYFTFTLGSSAVQPTDFAVGMYQAGVELSWGCVSMPDEFLIMRDNEVIATVDAADAAGSPGSYYAYDYTAINGVEYTYGVASRVGGLTRFCNQAVLYTPSHIAVYLSDPDYEIGVPILGDSEVVTSLQETAAMFEPLNRRDTVRIVSRIGGYDGSVSGTLIFWDDNRAEVWLSILENIVAARSTERLRLHFGTRNIVVNIGNLSVSQDPTQKGDATMYRVTFEFWQVGAFEPDVRY